MEPTMKERIEKLVAQGWAPEEAVDCFLAEEREEARTVAAEMQAEQSPQAEGWAAPQPVTPTLPDVPKMTPDMMPSPLREWAADIAQGIPAPLEYVGAASVIMAGILVGDRFAIKPKQNALWVVVPNLWGAFVGNPSQDKTPATSPVWAMLTRFQIKLDEAHKAKVKEYESDAELYKMKLEAARAAFKKAKGAEQDDAAAAIKALEAQAPEKPEGRTLFTNDATPEAVVECQRAGGGVGVLADELEAILQKFDKPGYEGARAFFLSGWSGTESYTQNRIGRGKTFLPRNVLSMAGTIQPDRIRRVVEDASRSDNDGLVQRFQVLVWPDPIEWAYVDTAPNHAAKKRAAQVLEALLDLTPEAIGARTDEYEKVPTLHFAPDAQEVFRGWMVALMTEEIAQAASPLMAQHLSKFRSLMPSLALIFHALDVADGAHFDTPGVSKRAADLAVQWCNFLGAHAKRFYVAMGDGTDKAAEVLASKLTAGKLQSGFSAKDVYGRHWAGLDVAKTHDAIARLESLGWLRKEPAKPQIMGRPAAPTYEVNPLIFE